MILSAVALFIVGAGLVGLLGLSFTIFAVRAIPFQSLSGSTYDEDEMANFNWLDTCPACGLVDYHMFRDLKANPSSGTKPVVERICNDEACAFIWTQH